MTPISEARKRSLFSDPASAVAPNLMIGSDKSGSIYLINRDKHDAVRHRSRQHQRRYPGFQYRRFVHLQLRLLQQCPVHRTACQRLPNHPGTATTTGHFDTTPFATANVNPSSRVISANGAANGIIWAEDTVGVLYAFDATTFATLYASYNAGSRDTVPTFVKFTSPIIANGKVFLSGQGSLAVYGFLQ